MVGVICERVMSESISTRRRVAREDSRKIGTTVLLSGALFALEQCALLLDDAGVLLENGRYQTSVVIALLAQAFRSCSAHAIAIARGVRVRSRFGENVRAN